MSNENSSASTGNSTGVPGFETGNVSESLQGLIDGYIAYANEVIKNRALPDGRDGLKPVNRRIIYRMSKEKNQMKSANIQGKVLELHPHGPASVYDAMVRMSDQNGTLNIPVIKGQGQWGRVYSSEKAASERYTECMLHDNAMDFLEDLDGVDFIPNFDSTTTEPVLLPVKYPNLLCNSVSGIAVGFRCNIPAFNLKDVCNLVKEYIEKGECSTVISPDFSTGGYYIKNDKELMKLMRTGKAKLKLRGRVDVLGKEINIREVPFGKTLQFIKSEIEHKNLAGVKNVSVYNDFEHGACLCVECTSKNRVDEVLMNLYKETSLQDTFSAEITSIIDDVPQTKGVWDYIQVWVDWRKQVLEKEYKKQIEALKEGAKYAKAFVEVVSNTENRDKLVDLLVHHSDSKAVAFLKEEYNLGSDVSSWIVQRRASQFRDGGKYVAQLERTRADIAKYEGYLNDLGAVISQQMDDIIAKRSAYCKRRTEITNVDYEFLAKDKSAEVAKDMTECTYEIKDGFIKKLRFATGKEKGMVVNALASDTLIALDNEGRVLRVYCENLPYSNPTEIGTYLPSYWGIEANDDYEIKYISKLDGETKMLIYNDGNIGFLDTSEWVGLTRQVKVVERGIFRDSSSLCYVCDSVPDFVYIMDEKGRIAYEMTSEIKRKARTARTKVFNLNKNSKITSVACLSGADGLKVLRNMGRYNIGKPIFLEDSSDYIAKGKIFKAC